jgi:hypothetical protein
MALFGGAVQSLSGSQIVGQYFTVVSFIPSTVLSSYLILLAKSGAWAGRVDFAHAITTLDAKDAVALGFGSFTLALVLFPMQYRMAQWLEGYWGRSLIALRLAAASTRRHRRRFTDLGNAARQYPYFIRGVDDAGEELDALAAKSRLKAIGEYISASEALRLATYYPERIDDVMPTRLGNVLRRHEKTAGAVYGLDAMAVVHRLMLVADSKHVAYVQDQRTSLDLAVRTVITALLATVATVAFMWSDGWWLLLALAPYSLAFAAYLGAVRSAYDYGLSFTTLVDLNRFALYEAMHLPKPDTYGEEIAQNKTLAIMLSGRGRDTKRPRSTFRYEHPASPPTSTPASGTSAGDPSA